MHSHPPPPSQVLLFRRAPGDDWADYAQVLSLAQTPVPAPHPSALSAVREVTASSQSAGEYDAPAGVSGFEFTLVLLSTWGDAYYVGLCGLQLLAPSGQALPVSPGQVKASPASVNDLPDAVAGPSGDPRVPANLVTGSVEADRVDESWLAPHAASLVPGQPNVVRIVFDEPAAVAALLVHNYAKTPARGVREFQLWVDGCIAYHGLLPPRTHAPQGHLIAVGTPSFPVRLLPPVRGQGSLTRYVLHNHPSLTHPIPPPLSRAASRRPGAPSRTWSSSTTAAPWPGAARRSQRRGWRRATAGRSTWRRGRGQRCRRAPVCRKQCPPAVPGRRGTRAQCSVGLFAQGARPLLRGE